MVIGIGLPLYVHGASELGNPNAVIEGELLIEADEGNATFDTTDHGLSITYANPSETQTDAPAVPTVQFAATESLADWLWGMNFVGTPITQMTLTKDNVLSIYDADALNNSPMIILDPELKEITIDGYPVLIDTPNGLDSLSVDSSESGKTLLSAEGAIVDVEGRLRVDGVDVLTYMDYVGQDGNLIYNSDAETGDLENFEVNFGNPTAMERIQRIDSNDNVHPIFEGFGERFPGATDITSAIMVESDSKIQIKLKQDIQVDTEKRYRLRGYVRMENLGVVDPRLAFYMDSFDRDGHLIYAPQITYSPKSTATLLADYTVGDSAIYIDQNWGDGANFTDGPNEWEEMNNVSGRYPRGLIVWAYQDYQYDDGARSYSRYARGSQTNYDYSSWVWDPIDVEYDSVTGGYEVPFKNIYANEFGGIGRVFPAGTQVSASSTGGTTGISLVFDLIDDNEWIEVDVIVGGGASQAHQFLTEDKNFLPATKYINLNIQHNAQDNAEGPGELQLRTYFAGLRFEPLDSNVIDESMTINGELDVNGDLTAETITADSIILTTASGDIPSFGQ